MAAAIDDVEFGIGHQHREQAAIGDGDDGIVLAHHDQRRCRDKGQERHAGPAKHRHQLIEIAGLARRADAADMPRRAVGRAAIERPEMRRHEFGIDIAARIGHLGQGRQLARDHDRPRRSRGQHHPPGAVGMLKGELLRHAAAPRHPHHVDRAGIAEMVEDLRCRARHHPWPVGHHRIGRSADAGHVERDEIAIVEQVGQRRDQFAVGADAVEEQERCRHARPGRGPAGDTQRAAVEAFGEDVGRGGASGFGGGLGVGAGGQGWLVLKGGGEKSGGEKSGGEKSGGERQCSRMVATL